MSGTATTGPEEHDHRQPDRGRFDRRLVQLGGLVRLEPELVRLEIRRPAGWPTIPVTIVHRDPKVVRALHGALSQVELEPTRPDRQRVPVRPLSRAGRGGDRRGADRGCPDPTPAGPRFTARPGRHRGQPGGRQRARSRDPRRGPRQRRRGSAGAGLPAGRARRPAGPARAAQPADPRAQDHRPGRVQAGDEFLIHLVERNRAGQVIGGISVQVDVVARKGGQAGRA